MATVQLSQSNRPITSPLLRLLSSASGSSLIAPHAYHSMPTNGCHIRHIQSLMYKYTSRYTPSYCRTGSPHACGHSPHTLHEWSCSTAAVLRDISGGTSYQAVRLVFRHYTHLTPSSCTSERLEASTELSFTFSSNKYSSLPFGSHPCVSPPSNPDADMISLVRVSRRAGHSPLPTTHFHFAPSSFHTSIALLLRYRSSTRI